MKTRTIDAKRVRCSFRWSGLDLADQGYGYHRSVWDVARFWSLTKAAAKVLCETRFWSKKSQVKWCCEAILKVLSITEDFSKKQTLDIDSVVRVPWVHTIEFEFEAYQPLYIIHVFHPVHVDKLPFLNNWMTGIWYIVKKGKKIFEKSLPVKLMTKHFKVWHELEKRLSKQKEWLFLNSFKPLKKTKERIIY